ncbi:dihydrofolate reductase family protein [Nocardia sp. NPDC005978]|uniref:dihydrofolate reductase family protein n=1 Tax=unclassified Nocardia TaxID=2637762 RepID=UPI0033AB3C56
MSKVVTDASMSLDGYIAGPGESGFEQLFAWYTAGDVDYPSTHPEVPFRLTPADHAYLAESVSGAGVYVVGRRLFDLTDGWGGVHPFDKPIVVVTHHRPESWIADHPAAPFTFVTDGVAAAIEQAKAIAGPKDVAVNGGTIAKQCLELGLLDEVRIDLVPVLLGGGVPFFDRIGAGPHEFGNPRITPGERVTHLSYPVEKRG